jgi:Phospholipase_D-nuclease N-terminal
MQRILVLVSLFLTIYSFFDCARTEQEQVRKMPKWAWLLLILLFLDPIGAVLWLTIGRPKKNRGPGRNRPGRIIPPDDDPDFLNKI